MIRKEAEAIFNMIHEKQSQDYAITVHLNNQNIRINRNDKACIVGHYLIIQDNTGNTQYLINTDKINYIE